MGSIKQNYANNVLTSGKFDATDLTGTIPSTNINNNSIDNVTSFPAAGSGIPAVASDPPAPTVGDVWYNTTTNKFKYAGAGTGSWASGGNLNISRRGNGAAGTQTAAITFGGEAPGGPYTLVTETYNGTSWTNGNSMNNTAYRTSGMGISTAAKQICGGTNFSVDVEDWDGTSWTETADVSTPRGIYNATTGTQTAGIVIGGVIPVTPYPTGSTANVENWDGSTWTEVNNLNTGRKGGGAGTQTAAIFSGGSYFPSPGTPTGADVTNVETWDGTSWTETADINTARSSHGTSGTTSTAVIYAGYSTAPTVITETWDGSSWTEVADMSTARSEIGGLTGAPYSLTLGTGGEIPAWSNATEEWTVTAFTAKSVTTA